jgi:hypothetical protein
MVPVTIVRNRLSDESCTNVPKWVRWIVLRLPLVLEVCFYDTNHGREPVREWLKSLLPDARKSIGEDIKTVQFG